jgi:23S rRNA pseudouridine1911/1915/1917 synthase
MANTDLFVVGRLQAGTALLRFVADSLGISGKKAKQVLDARDVFVNDRRVWIARHRLSAGDRVSVLRQAHRPGRKRKSIPVLYEDDDYLIVNKPPGMLSNGPASVEATVGMALDAPGLRAVHRLDRDTSGCLLLARGSPQFGRMVPLFRQGKVVKGYRVIARGRVDPAVKTIDSKLEDRRAVTRLKVLDANAEASHLLVTIDTGRTHQIRKHLASIRHAVIGDRRYGTRTPATRRAAGAGRQMLHAARLQFVHPVTGRLVRVFAPLPRDFRSCLKALHLT